MSKKAYDLRYKDRVLFGGNREKAIQRDGEKCVKCGMTREQHRKTFGRDITVDHIDGNGRYTPAGDRNNSLDNLMTLCMPCHGVKDGGRHAPQAMLWNPLCKKCGATRSLMRSGEWRCKPCQAEYNYRKYHENIEEARKKSRDSYWRTREKRLARAKMYHQTERGKQALKDTKSRYPEKVYAREQLAYAVSSGAITRPRVCTACNLERSIQAHHTDYSKPLEVMWLCTPCHAEQHRLEKLK